MKIGIITMPLCANYGGILQNWALQQVLIRMGHEPITFRFPVMYQGMTLVHYWMRVFPVQVARFFGHKLLGGKYEMPLTIRPWRKSVSGMEKFVDEHINVSDYLPNLSMDDVKKYGVEALVVGSDQIWRPVMYDAVKYYFLGFTKNHDILRIAYAPSIALDEWPFSDDTTIQLRELIKNFSAISVREESSVKLLEDHLGVDANWVLDPTMLLDKEDYLELCKDVPKSKDSFVFAYILDMTEDKRIMAEKVAKIKGCSIRYLTTSQIRLDDTIEKWLANFRDSVYVITDSYHGAVFSLLFQKQFYCFYNTYRGNARMDSLKKISSLENRFLTEIVDDIIDKIDYTEVEKKIDKMREQSISFLCSAICKEDHQRAYND